MKGTTQLPADEVSGKVGPNGPAPPVGSGEQGLTRARVFSFTFFACALFVVIGIVTTVLGPILPLLSIRWSISIAQAASLFLWQFITSTIGTLMSGLVFGRRSFRLPILIGVALCLIGIGSLLVVDWSLARYAVACYGLGLGAAIPALNLAVAEVNQSKRGSAISILNFSWGIGAVLGPTLLQLTHHLDMFLILLALLLAAGLMGAVIWEPPGNQASPIPSSLSTAQMRLWTVVPLLMLSTFFMCGAENAVAGWASTVALSSFADAFKATNANQAFWLFFLFSRALSPIVLRYWSDNRLLLNSILIAAIGVLALSLATNAGMIVIACALAGLGIGPGFPMLISRISSMIGGQHPAATVCFAFAGIGAATLPTMVGLLGAHLGQVRSGLLLPFAGLVLMLPIAMLTETERRKSWESEPGALPLSKSP